MERYLTIGQMCNLFKLNVQTLRYYDSLGLLVPDRRNTQTGYREYKFEQVYKLATIRYLRKIGFSIKEIETYMEYRDIEYTLKSLKQQSVSLRKQWKELINIDSVIQRKIKYIEYKMQNIDTNEIIVKEFSKRYYLPIGTEERLYLSDIFYFYPTIAFYEKDIKSFGAFIYSDDIEAQPEYTNHLADLLEIPAGKYLCGYHLGTYENLFETSSKLKEAFSHLSLGESMINFNIIDQFVEADGNKYITEIQIPVI